MGLFMDISAPPTLGLDISAPPMPKPGGSKLTPEDEDLLRKLVEGGQVGDKQKALQAQMQAAQAMRDTPMAKGIETRGMYIAQPFSSIGAGLNSYLGGQRMNALNEQNKGLLAQKAAGEEASARAAMTAPSGNVNTMDVLGGNDAQARAALAESDKGVDRARVLGNALLASSDPNAQRMGAQLLKQSEAASAEGMKASGLRFTAGQEKQAQALRMAMDAQHSKELIAAMSNQTKENIHDQNVPVKLPDGRVLAFNKHTQDWQIIGEPNTKPDTGAGGRADSKEWLQVWNKISPDVQSSRSVLGTDAATIKRIDRAQALVEKRGGNVTPEEMSDLSVALAGVLTGGSVTARQTINDVAYKTLGMKGAELVQYLSGKPQDARMAPFVARVNDTLKIERDAARERIRNSVRHYASGLPDIVKKNEHQAVPGFRNLGLSDADLKELGLDPSIGSEPAAPSADIDALLKKYGGAK